MYVNDSLRNAYLTLKEKPTIILLFIGYEIFQLPILFLYLFLIQNASNPSNLQLFTLSIVFLAALIIVNFVFYIILASMSVMIAKQKIEGGKILLKKAFSDAKPFFARTAGLFIVIFLIFGIIATLMVSGFIFGGIGGFLIILISFVLSVFLAVTITQSLTISIIENLGIIASIKKSYNKSLPFFWSIFEIEFAISAIAGAIVSIGYLISLIFSPILGSIISSISSIIFTPIFLIAIPLFYFYSNQKPNQNKPEIGTSSVPPKISQS
jgi:hypothetical protein